MVSNAILQHVCASGMVSLFQGGITICASCSNVPVAVENDPFSNTTAIKRISPVTCLARHCKCYQLLPASLLIAVIPGFIPLGCSGQLKGRRKRAGLGAAGLDLRLQLVVRPQANAVPDPARIRNPQNPSGSVTQMQIPRLRPRPSTTEYACEQPP